MHICFICGEYPPGKHGGVGGFTQTLGRALVRRGHRVTVVGVYDQPSDVIETDQGVTVARLSGATFPGMGFPTAAVKLRRGIRRLGADAPIDVVEGPELSLAWLPAAMRPVCVIRMHGGHHFFRATLGNRPAAWRAYLERRSFRRADRVCAVSRFVAETTRTLLNLGGIPIEVLPNPVDTARFRPRPEIPEEEGLIVFTGTVCEKKGVRQLVQAMPKIVAEVPQARLWIIGRDWTDPKTGRSYVEQLRQCIGPELEDRIEIKGPVDNERLPGILARARVLIYPSHMEAMPVAWLEGLAMGKAVVASKTGPGREAIEDGVSGLLCDPHDPVSIAGSIISVLKDAEQRQRMGEKARARALDLYSVEALLDKNETFYTRCLNERRSGQRSC